MFRAKLGWNWPSGPVEKDENVKSLQMDGQKDNGRQVIRKAYFGSGELKQNLLKNLLMFNIHYIQALNVPTIYESIISNKNILSSQVWNKQSPK